jgi:hypothetical protein
LPAPAGVAVTGEGYWRFVAATNQVLLLPAEVLPRLRGAHGTLVVDAERDVVYWGLEQVGWVAFSNRLTQSWVVQGDPRLATGNLHGADLLRRPGRLPLIAAADNVEGEVYLSDTTFQRAEVLDWPAQGPYAAKAEYHPTDVAFVRKETLFVTDGYGKAFFMPAGLASLAYLGAYHGGKEISQTPHGITTDPDGKSLLIAARPEAQVRRWSTTKDEWREILSLPAGSTVCDIEVWGDYALAPCLDGPEQTPGPIYILNLKRRTIVSTLRPKVDLGFAQAQHIHDAAWYRVKRGRQTELYVLFTHWNPGGIGALRLVAAR